MPFRLLRLKVRDTGEASFSHAGKQLVRRMKYIKKLFETMDDIDEFKTVPVDQVRPGQRPLPVYSSLALSLSLSLSLSPSLVYIPPPKCGVSSVLCVWGP